MRRILAAIMVLTIVMWTYPATAEIEKINPYVIKADVRAYMTESDIALYEKLLDGVFARATRVDLSGDYDANLRAFGALQGNPYYFFIEKLSFTSDHTAVNLTYAYSAEEQTEMRDYMDGEYRSILNSIITPDMNDLDKTLAVYQYFGKRISYDYEWLGALDMASDKFLFPEIEIYQALKTNKGVCHSYSYLCEFALQQLGIECMRLSGDVTGTDEGHMWLVVKLDGHFYHIDPTWDDNGDTEGLTFFGMTDAERIASGVDNYGMSYDGAYGEIVCDANTFSAFRGAVDFSFIQGDPHRILLDYGGHTVIFDTEAMAVVEG